MHGFLADWTLLVAVFFLALLSPGPDFVVAVRNAVLYSRRVGVLTAAGFALGVGVHVTYCLGGLALIISQSIVVFSILKYIGAAYLFFIGIQALRSKGYTESSGQIGNAPLVMTDLQALRSGFITNLFNPKATLFFLALFTQILSPGGDLAHRAVYGMTCVMMTFLWFTVVATVLTTPRIKKQFLRFSKWLDRLCGAALIALGIRLASTKL